MFLNGAVDGATDGTDDAFMRGDFHDLCRVYGLVSKVEGATDDALQVAQFQRKSRVSN